MVLMRKDGSALGEWGRGSCGVGLSKAIYKETDFLKQNNSFKLGNGFKSDSAKKTSGVARILFDSFLALYNLSNIKGATVSEVWVP